MADASNELQKLARSLQTITNRVNALFARKNFTLQIKFGQSYSNLEQFTSKLRETKDMIDQLQKGEVTTRFSDRLKKDFKEANDLMKGIVQQVQQYNTLVGQAKAKAGASAAGLSSKGPTSAAGAPGAPTNDQIKRAQEFAKILQQVQQAGSNANRAKSWAEYFNAVAISARSATQGATSFRDRMAAVVNQVRDTGAFRPLSGVFNSLNTAVKGSIANLIYWQARWFLVKNAIFGTINAIKEGFRTWIDFDQRLKSIQAITGATAKQMAGLIPVIKTVANTTRFGLTELADAAVILAQAGLSIKEVSVALPAVANLATATLSDLNSVTELVTTTMASFDLQLNEIAQTADLFSNAVSSSKLTIDKIGTAFNYVAPIAGQLNLSISETLTTLGLLADRGLKASTAATSLRTLFGELVAPSEKFAKALNKAGISVEEINPSFVSMDQIIQRLSESTFDVTSAFEGLPKRAASGISALIGAGAEGFNRLNNEISQTGTATFRAETQLQGLSQLFLVLKQNASTLFQTLADSAIGDRLANVLEKIITKVQEFNDKLQNSAGFAENISDTIVSGFKTALGVLIYTIVPNIGKVLGPILGSQFGIVGKTVGYGLGAAIKAGVALFGTDFLADYINDVTQAADITKFKREVTETFSQQTNVRRFTSSIELLSKSINKSKSITAKTRLELFNLFDSNKELLASNIDEAGKFNDAIERIGDTSKDLPKDYVLSFLSEVAEATKKSSELIQQQLDKAKLEQFSISLRNLVIAAKDASKELLLPDTFTGDFGFAGPTAVEQEKFIALLANPESNIFSDLQKNVSIQLRNYYSQLISEFGSMTTEARKKFFAYQDVIWSQLSKELPELFDQKFQEIHPHVMDFLSKLFSISQADLDTQSAASIEKVTDKFKSRLESISKTIDNLRVKSANSNIISDLFTKALSPASTLVNLMKQRNTLQNQYDADVAVGKANPGLEQDLKNTKQQIIETSNFINTSNGLLTFYKRLNEAVGKLSTSQEEENKVVKDFATEYKNKAESLLAALANANELTPEIIKELQESFVEEFKAIPETLKQQLPADLQALFDSLGDIDANKFGAGTVEAIRQALEIIKKGSVELLDSAGSDLKDKLKAFYAQLSEIPREFNDTIRTNIANIRTSFANAKFNVKLLADFSKAQKSVATSGKINSLVSGYTKVADEITNANSDLEEQLKIQKALSLISPEKEIARRVKLAAEEQGILEENYKNAADYQTKLAEITRDTTRNFYEERRQNNISIDQLQDKIGKLVDVQDKYRLAIEQSRVSLTTEKQVSLVLAGRDAIIKEELASRLKIRDVIEEINHESDKAFIREARNNPYLNDTAINSLIGYRKERLAIISEVNQSEQKTLDLQNKLIAARDKYNLLRTNKEAYDTGELENQQAIVLEIEEEIIKQNTVNDTLQIRLSTMDQIIKKLQDSGSFTDNLNAGLLTWAKSLGSIGQNVSNVVVSTMEATRTTVTNILTEIATLNYENNAQLKAQRDQALAEEKFAYKQQSRDLKISLASGAVDYREYYSSLVEMNLKSAEAREKIEKDYKDKQKTVLDSIRDNFKSLFDSILKIAIETFVKIAAAQAAFRILSPDTPTSDLASVFFSTHAKGGKVIKKYADGGGVNGFIPTSLGKPNVDSVPILAMGGEYVVKKSSVQKYGEDFMHRLNAGMFDPKKMPKFARGGSVGGTSSYPNRTNSNEQPVEVVIYNVTDMNQIPRQVSKEDIVNTIVFDASTNGPVIQTIRKTISR